MVDFLTPDGCQTGIANWAQLSDPCCSTAACIDPCDIACDLIETLPTGPMWDKQRADALEWLNSRNSAPWDLCRPLIECDTACPTLALFAVFLSQRISSTINETIWAAVRESNPFTAVTSLAAWKDRLNYQDCFRSQCRSSFSNVLSPFEVDEGNGTILYCPPNLPDDMLCALDHAIVVALQRMQVGGIPNLCYLNWIIEPFGAQIKPACICEDPDVDGPCVEEDCCDAQYMVCPSSCTLKPCPPLNCYEDNAPASIPACVDQTCTAAVGQPDIIWPGVILAVCFLRSYLPQCPSIIYYCGDSDTPDTCDCLVLTEDYDLVADDPLPGCRPIPRDITDLCGDGTPPPI